MRHTSALFALSFVLIAPAGMAADLQGKVVGIADGDTLTLLDAEKRQHKIRLAQIDAPENLFKVSGVMRTLEDEEELSERH